MGAPNPAFLSCSLRPGHPDFLDLPWGEPLSSWAGRSERLVQLPVGPSRHPVVFAEYDGRLYALKELPPGLAEREYELLRRMEEARLPVVSPAGTVQARSAAGEASVLVTRYLDRSLPYHLLFQKGSLNQTRDHLLDALANLLVELHLSGVFWGDCSLYNALFRRDAGALGAYLVDAETSEIQAVLSAARRAQDLEIAEENVCGALADLQAGGSLPADLDIAATGRYLGRRYAELWGEIAREEVLSRDERYRIQERVRSLNALGFSVDEVELIAAEGGRLRIRALVADRHFHRNLLLSLTGLDAEELQAQKLLNEIREQKAALSRQRNRSTPLSVAAYAWLHELYLPLQERLAQAALQAGPPAAAQADPVELYCELLEHKWYLSEAAHQDVGHQMALEDYLQKKSGA
ncbi:MAG TPA: DUF4032 domain-containing protein [Myxococcota bacterium]|nr:DUF4032 domain-containing protein [Myxococcota bacterium]HRY96923.1 DUF4032 domain-containing protein [Myxococcota bacterium]HSA22488.1 DUF4032 domain-containing protein [Myxococcota bacterium]